MVKKTIQKRSSPVARELKEIRDAVHGPFLFCEGLKLLEELVSSSLKIRGIYCLSDLEEGIKRLLEKNEKAGTSVILLSKDVMAFVSDLKTPPGIVAVAKRKDPQPDLKINLKNKPLILVLHQIQLPQNVGALVRTAEAAGVAEIWTTTHTADPFGPKALRGSTGSVFRIPIRTNLKLHDILQFFHKEGIQVAAATQEGKVSYDSFNWRQPTALVLGSEGSGFTLEEMKYLQTTVRIPMKGLAESLNVGVAGAVCLFEASRQRT